MTALEARAALDIERQRHIHALVAALAAGVPVDEVVEDAMAFGMAVGQILALADAVPSGRA